MVVSLELDSVLENRVHRLANRHNRSTDWIMLEAIAQYVEREEAREDFRQEARASWDAYKENGRHLTGEELWAWLHTCGTDQGGVVPECHK